MSQLYLHIPFCRQACYYCDFHFSTRLENKSRLCDAMHRELLLQRNYLPDQPLQSIYFGGGTPSLLTEHELSEFMDKIHMQWDIDMNAEITLEANPCDITKSKLMNWKHIGINRLSIGVQSFDDAILKYCNRIHTARDALDCIDLANNNGPCNLNIDLIYAIPGLSMTGWMETLTKTVQLRPSHISAYCLTIEPKTVFGVWKKQGRFQPIPDQIAAQQFEQMIVYLTDQGYQHDEISAFSLPEYAAKHNHGYWKQCAYLGIGPSAHSYNGSTRQYNIANNIRYIDALGAGTIPCTIEHLTRSDHINEYIMTRLRTSDGCDLNWLKTKYQYDVKKNHSVYLKRIVDQKFAILRGNNLQLTLSGKLLADQISSDLFCLET